MAGFFLCSGAGWPMAGAWTGRAVEDRGEGGGELFGEAIGGC